MLSSFPRIFRRWNYLATLVVLQMLFLGCCLRLGGQTLAGSSVADTAGPTLISPSSIGKDYFVLNKDLSITGRFNAQTTSPIACAPPAGFSAISPTQRTLLNDGSSAYFTAQAASANAAASTASPGYPCTSAAALEFAGGTPAQTLTSNDPRHGRYYVLESFNGSAADTLTVVNNLNSNSSNTRSLTKQSSVTVDTGAVYTAMLTDTTSDYANTIITERRTDTSPGGLLVYSPGIQTVFRILGPGGKPLPAIGAFFMPSPANDNGQLLVLVNQDGLTSSNLSGPPAVTNPFTIIDLGQLQRAFSAVASQGKTITLPRVTTVTATQSYFATFGAVYSPVFHLAYALVASGTSSSAVTQSILRYDLTNPSAPAETVVADVSNIPLTFGTYPQLALNAAAGSLAILSGGDVYNVVVAGRNNTATRLTGATFGDSNYAPTFVASNPLLGETYIASTNAVDILGITGTTTKRAVLELYGPDNAVANQSYLLQVGAVNPDNDSDLTFANVTFTATPDGGSAISLGTGQFYQYTGAGITSQSLTFPAAGIYTVIATVPATANYPAITSLPIRVGVGTTRGAPVYPTATRLVVPATSSSTAVAAQLFLDGSTYAPSGRIVVSDSSGNEVGRYTFTGGATAYPVTANLTLPSGSSTLTATYNGDSQNQTSSSAAATVNVGKVTPTLAIATQTTAAPGSTVSGSLQFNSSSTTVPTGNVTVYQIASSSGTTVTIATIAASQAAATGGAAFSFTAPTASDTYRLYASYDGDSTFDLAYSPTYRLTVASSIIATTLNLSVPATPSPNTAFTANVTLRSTTAGSTAPTGSITVLATDSKGSVTTLGSATAAQAYASGGYAISAKLANTGPYSVTASYNGDSSYASSTATVSLAVKAEVALFLSVPANSISGSTLSGQLQITPSVSSPAPTGSYVVTATSTSGTTVTLATIPAASVTGPVANFTFTAPAGGRYSAVAAYQGDVNFFPKVSSAAGLVVSDVNATTTSVSAVASITRNTPFIVTVRFTPKTNGSIAPTGNVTLTTKDALGTITTDVVPVSSAQASGGYQKQVQFYFTGSASITATYAGDPYYSSSTGTVSVDVIAYTGALTVNAPPAITAGVPASLNVKFVPATATQTPPTEPVFLQLFDTAGSLIGSAYAEASAYLSAAGASVNITPDLTGNTLAGTPMGQAGPATVVANFGGGATLYAQTQAKTGTVIALNKPVLTLTGVASGTLGTAYSATLKLGNAPSASGGSVNIAVSGTGASFNVTASAADAINGVTVPVTFSLAGTYALVASYTGDSNNTPATAATLTVTVGVPGGTTPTFVVTAADSSVSDQSGAVPIFVLGGTAHIGFVLTGYNSYATPVTLTFSKVSGDTNLFGNFTDAASQVVITSVTPAAVGTPVVLNVNFTKSLLPQIRLGSMLFGLGFGGCSLMVLRRRGIQKRRILGQLRSLGLLTLPLLLLSSLAVMTGCGTDYNYGKYVVTATPAAGATDQTVRTVTVWLKTQRS